MQVSAIADPTGATKLKEVAMKGAVIALVGVAVGAVVALIVWRTVKAN
jgi:hypothetical protein